MLHTTLSICKRIQDASVTVDICMLLCGGCRYVYGCCIGHLSGSTCILYMPFLQVGIQCTYVVCRASSQTYGYYMRLLSFGICLLYEVVFVQHISARLGNGRPAHAPLSTGISMPLPAPLTQLQANLTRQNTPIDIILHIRLVLIDVFYNSPLWISLSLFANRLIQFLQSHPPHLPVAS